MSGHSRQLRNNNKRINNFTPRWCAWSWSPAILPSIYLAQLFKTRKYFKILQIQDTKSSFLNFYHQIYALDKMMRVQSKDIFMYQVVYGQDSGPLLVVLDIC